MNLLSHLRRLVANRSSTIQTRDGASRLSHRSRHPYWIVGRGLCLYHCENFSNVPRSRRRSALELKLPVWSPFVRTGYHCVWSGGSAMMWYWDEDKIAAAREASGHGQGDAGARSVARARVLPETVFYPRKPDGVHLQPCREGFELQHWQADLLLDALWYPERPGPRQLGGFLGRQQGAARALPLDRILESPDSGVATESWTTSLTPAEWLEANERKLGVTCLLALSLVVVWQEARLWKVRHLEEAAAAELARMEEQLGPLLEARSELFRLRRTNRALTALLSEPSQAHLMALVDRALANSDAEFREWHYQQGELRMVVVDPNPDPIATVRALEAVPLFDRVRAQSARGGEGRLEITLEVRG